MFVWVAMNEYHCFEEKIVRAIQMPTYCWTSRHCSKQQYGNPATNKISRSEAASPLKPTVTQESNYT